MARIGFQLVSPADGVVDEAWREIVERPMFPLATQDIPTDAAALEQALRASFRVIFAKPPKSPVRIAELPNRGFPELKSVEIDLSGAAVDLAHPPLRPQPVAGKSRPGPTVQSLVLKANPLLLQDSPLDFHLIAQDVAFEYKRDQLDRPLLMIERARDGHVELTMGRDDLESALLQVLQTAVADHGVAIKNIAIDLEQDTADPSSVAAHIEITVKKFVTAVIHLSGQLQLDDELNARFSDIQCRGEGMLASMACGFIRPHLSRVNNRKFSLMAFSLGDVALRDLDFRFDDQAVSIRARFGEA